MLANTVGNLKTLVYTSRVKTINDLTKYKVPKPAGYWDNSENVLQYLRDLQSQFNLKTSEDWNSITMKQIESTGGSRLLRKYSIFDLKCLGHPEGKKIFNKPYKPPGYWDNNENVNNFLKTIKNKYNLKTINDWNSITKKQIENNGGGRLFSRYSMYELKCIGFPEGKLIFKKPIKKLPLGFWNDENNIKTFLFDLKLKLNLNSIHDWNQLSQFHIKKYGGSRLLSKYSMFDLKCLACPEGKFIFKHEAIKKSANYWDDPESIVNFVNKMKKKFNINCNNDWKRVSKSQIRSNGGWGFYINNKIDHNIPEIVNINPNFKRSSQRWLFLQIQKLFPHDEIVEDYFHSELSRKSGFNIQFDIFLIQRNIAFEYHGKQHYEDIPSGFSPLELFKSRDNEKEKLCQEFGIQLIVIPYWWNNKIDSLQQLLATNQISVNENSYI